MTNEKDLFFNRVWTFFASVRLSVITLLLLAVTSIIGTIIPQNQSLDAYRHKFGDTVFTIFANLNFFDMYHSWWFQFLILVLAINIVICSMDRLPSIWKIVAKKPDFKIDRFRRYKNRHEVAIMETGINLEQKYKTLFSKKFGKPVFEKTDDGFYLFGEKGRWTRMGVYVVHASILLLLAGGMAGSIKGFEGTVKITEGESADSITLKKNQGHVKLNFKIRCDKFEMSRYDNGMTKEYKSDLTIIENGKEVLKKSIVVNDPLRYKGINIFQSFYGSVPTTNLALNVANKQVLNFTGNLALNFTGKESGMTYEKEVTTGQEIDLPENFGKFRLMGFIPSYNFSGHNIGETFVGLITKVSGETRKVILPHKFETADITFDEMFKPDVAVTIADLENTIADLKNTIPDYENAISDKGQKFYTGLQITYDPGVNMVYAGFFFMIIGCCIAFFMSHQSFCMEIILKNENEHLVMISGSANKNKLSMKIRINNIADSIRNQST